MVFIKVVIIGFFVFVKIVWVFCVYFLYFFLLLGCFKFEVVVFFNLLIEVVCVVIKVYNLFVFIKVYGMFEDLVVDLEVEFVIINIWVDKYFEIVFFFVIVGKDVYIEWFFVVNIIEVRILVDVVKQYGGLGIVGLQGFLGFLLKKFREVIFSGRIGEVLSLEFRVNGGIDGWGVILVLLLYFIERKVGGYVYIIGFVYCQFFCFC